MLEPKTVEHLRRHIEPEENDMTNTDNTQIRYVGNDGMLDKHQHQAILNLIADLRSIRGNVGHTYGIITQPNSRCYDNEITDTLDSIVAAINISCNRLIEVAGRDVEL